MFQTAVFNNTSFSQSITNSSFVCFKINDYFLKALTSNIKNDFKLPLKIINLRRPTEKTSPDHLEILVFPVRIVLSKSHIVNYKTTAFPVN